MTAAALPSVKDTISRKAALYSDGDLPGEGAPGPVASATIRGVEFLEGDGATIFAHACRLGLEGIVCRRADSPYRAGPSKTWLKVKNRAHPSIARVKDAIELGRFRRR